MSTEAFIDLSPRDKIWVVSGWVTAGTKFVQNPNLLEEHNGYVLEYLQEFQLVQPAHDIINFYTHDVLTPKGSTVLCVSYPEVESGGTTTHRRKSYLFAKGEASEVYQTIKGTLEQFIDLQVNRLHKWEIVTVYRPHR